MHITDPQYLTWYWCRGVGHFCVHKKLRSGELVRLKFPNKDLANMCGISEPSVKQKLVDYKERLKVPAGGMSFKQFISKF